MVYIQWQLLPEEDGVNIYAELSVEYKTLLAQELVIFSDLF